MCWIYRVVDNTNTEEIYFYALNNGYGSYVGMGVYSSPSQLYLDQTVAATTAFGATLALATWYHVAMVFDDTANTLTSYLNAVQDQQITGMTGTFTPGFEAIGNFDVGTYPNFVNGRVAAVKLYTGVLTANEIAAEMRSYLPLRTANLHSWLPLRDVGEQGTNYGGTGNFTAAGTLTTEDGPPIPWTLRPTAARRFAAAAAPTVAPRPPLVIQWQASHRASFF